MATTGEVRFASYLKGVLAKINGISNLTTSESTEAAIYKELQDLIQDANLVLTDPKKSLVVKAMIDQVAYYNITRVKPPAGQTTRSRQATAGHVYKMLSQLFPILEVDPQVLVQEVSIPKNPVGDVKVPAPAPEDTAKTEEKVKDAPAKDKTPFYKNPKVLIGTGIAAAILVAFTQRKKIFKNPRRRRNPSFTYTVGPVVANPRRYRKSR